jgi:uncharacterized membrane protein YdjX (TVP38/TMEM64 family)
VTRRPPGGGTWIGLGLALLGIGLIAAMVLAIPALRDALGDAVSGDTGSVREDLSSGIEGALLVIALAVVHVVVWYPAEILDAAAGYVYGFGVALPLVMGAWMLSAVLAYELGRHAARPLLYKVLGEERVVRLERLIERGGATFLLAARLVPIVPFSLLCIVCGAAHVPMRRFLWTTLVGYLPITVYFIYLGSRLESFSLEDPIVWIGAGGLLLALLLVRHLMPRRYPEEEEEASPSRGPA